MATCEEWQLWMNGVLRYTRGVGPEPGDAPDGRPPEGCNVYPCPGNTELTPFNNLFISKLNERDNLNASRPPGCGPIKLTVRRVVSGGQVLPVFDNYTNEPSPCGPFTAKAGTGNPITCFPPPAPPDPPPPPVYSEPMNFLIEPTPSGGWSVTSASNVWPSVAYFEQSIQDYQCICDNLFKIFKILQQQFPTAYFQQTNVISHAEQMRAGFNMLAQVLQYAVADMTGREPRLVNSEVVTVPTVQEVVLPNP